jgi:hypothetical protein
LRRLRNSPLQRFGSRTQQNTQEQPDGETIRVGGFSGEGNAWLHSNQQHIVERWSRPSKNYLIYQITIEDPMILTKPWTSAPRKWSLAAPDDEWTEVFCTHNEEPDEWKHIDKSVKDDYENKYKK